MSLVLCMFCVILIPLAFAGLALIQQGLGRSRSAAHTMLATLCVLAITAIIFVAFGFSWAGIAGGPAHSFTVRGSSWNWIGALPLLSRGVQFDESPGALVLCFHMFAVGLAGIIPIGTASGRWRLAAICSSSAVLAGIIYPLFSHWVWGGGWLSQLGSRFGLGIGFVDAGGSGTIHVVGGIAALVTTWIVGPRSTKYADDGSATAIPGHNMVMVLFGCILTLLGWMGLNCSASLLFYNGFPLMQITRIIVNTMLCASSACLAAVVVTRIRYGKPDASLSANGWVGGLVAGSAGCLFVSPMAMIIIGVFSGVMIPFLAEILELRLKVDDPGGAISVHGAAGIWGLLALGIFAHIGSGLQSEQLLAQFVGVATLLGFMLPLIYGSYWLLNLVVRFRVDEVGDRRGMDIRELGAEAYPEYVIHSDDFTLR